MVNNVKLTPDLLKNWTSVWKNLSLNSDKHYLLKRLSDASTKSQLQSKLWLINELKNVKTKVAILKKRKSDPNKERRENKIKMTLVCT